MHYAVYNTTTGQVLSIGTSQFVPLERIAVSVGEAAIEIPSRKWKYWVDLSGTTAVVKEKAPMNLAINKTTLLADYSDVFTATGLHNPSTVTWPDGEVTTETDGEASFAIDQAGEFTLKIDAIPYLAEVINVTAINPT